nr:MAG TPA: hypothetical protein [Caudoviricetes sp.]
MTRQADTRHSGGIESQSLIGSVQVVHQARRPAGGVPLQFEEDVRTGNVRLVAVDPHIGIVSHVPERIHRDLFSHDLGEVHTLFGDEVRIVTAYGDFEVQPVVACVGVGHACDVPQFGRSAEIGTSAHGKGVNLHILVDHLPQLVLSAAASARLLRPVAVYIYGFHLRGQVGLVVAYVPRTAGIALLQIRQIAILDREPLIPYLRLDVEFERINRFEQAGMKDIDRHGTASGHLQADALDLRSDAQRTNRNDLIAYDLAGIPDRVGNTARAVEERTFVEQTFRPVFDCMTVDEGLNGQRYPGLHDLAQKRRKGIVFGPVLRIGKFLPRAVLHRGVKFLSVLRVPDDVPGFVVGRSVVRRISGVLLVGHAVVHVFQRQQRMHVLKVKTAFRLPQFVVDPVFRIGVLAPADESGQPALDFGYSIHFRLNKNGGRAFPYPRRLNLCGRLRSRHLFRIHRRFGRIDNLNRNRRYRRHGRFQDVELHDRVGDLRGIGVVRHQISHVYRETVVLLVYTLHVGRSGAGNTRVVAYAVLEERANGNVQDGQRRDVPLTHRAEVRTAQGFAVHAEQHTHVAVLDGITARIGAGFVGDIVREVENLVQVLVALVHVVIKTVLREFGHESLNSRVADDVHAAEIVVCGHHRVEVGKGVFTLHPRHLYRVSCLRVGQQLFEHLRLVGRKSRDRTGVERIGQLVEVLQELALPVLLDSDFVVVVQRRNHRESPRIRYEGNVYEFRRVLVVGDVAATNIRNGYVTVVVDDGNLHFAAVGGKSTLTQFVGDDSVAGIGLFDEQIKRAITGRASHILVEVGINPQILQSGFNKRHNRKI